MQDPLALALVLVFVAVAVLTGLVASVVMTRSSRSVAGCARWRRPPARSTIGLATLSLTDRPGQMVRRVSTFVPKSPKEMGRLQRRMVRAGFRNPQRAAVLFALAEIILPVVFALTTLFFWACSGRADALLAAGVGYALPGLLLARKTAARQKQIQNGLPDALDLLIVCVEAGPGLDAAIVKASEELALAYPPSPRSFELITTETRAGKPRLEAFRNFAQRTGVDDVRSLVAMLVQTDRFGTSIAQALRTHAATSPDQAPPASRGASRQAGGEAGVPAGLLSVSGAVCGGARPGGHQDHALAAAAE